MGFLDVKIFEGGQKLEFEKLGKRKNLELETGQIINFDRKIFC
jgi:hypothetical protein